MTTLTVKRTHLCLEDLSESLQMSPRRVEIMLSESVADGVVELVADGYRLSASAEGLVGDALRSLEDPE